mgnify:FL=1|tara:strand:+ start:2797 stop:3951 length:1155 start_codon:yes stop_codon:yes gene_type:complete
MIKEEILNFRKNKCCTLLGVGPMSVNCIDTAIDIANEYSIPIFLISSRRQIDCDSKGKGYVNNWSTLEFSNYVKKRDKKGVIYLARDHGGPWQNPIEKKFNLTEAMESAKDSYLEDMKAGYKILHIDPSIDIHEEPDTNEILNRAFELYEYCWEQAQRMNIDIAFEIGTEEQSGSTNCLEEFEYTLDKMTTFCAKNKIPTPLFVVAQTGTKVMEMKNIGSFESPIRVENEIPAEIQLPKVLEICKKFNVLMKEHNADYLSNDSLQWHPKLGIPAANVAPEFGVTESKTFLKILEENNLTKLANDFIQISYDSMKWEKWIIKDSKIDDKNKAIIAGHYVFSSKDFLELKSKAFIELKRKGLNLDELLCKEIKKNILRYVKNFNLI